jgi:hypothetical protein
MAWRVPEVEPNNIISKENNRFYDPNDRERNYGLKRVSKPEGEAQIIDY